ncbi:MAG: tRNA (adenosine(37)-N6)-threonylcarbamoyltransferase complex ATPase subunit type 1 TsaE [Puniceicoccaceae bacterium]
MDILDELKEGIVTASAEETEAVGARLAAAVVDNSTIALSGDLGAGKTTLARGIARGLEITADVTSPTYTIYTTYQGTRQLVHMDAYRLSDAHELDSLTIEEFLKPPWLIVVEWPEHVPGFFEDKDTLRIKIEILPDHSHRIHIIDQEP